MCWFVILAAKDEEFWPFESFWARRFYRGCDERLPKWIDREGMGHADVLLTNPLSSEEAPAGYPDKNSNNRNNRKRAWDDGKRGKAGASLLSFPFPSCPALSIFLSPQPPHNTQRPLQRREWRTPKNVCVGGFIQVHLQKNKILVRTASDSSLLISWFEKFSIWISRKLDSESDYIVRKSGQSPTWFHGLQLAYSAHVKGSKIGLDFGFHAVDFGFHVLDSWFFVSRYWRTDSSKREGFSLDSSH